MLQESLAYLFTPRSGEAQSRRISAYPIEWMDGLVLALYTAVLSWDIYHHCPWMDEAQAWLIARDESLRGILLRRLHYEGAPALWHFILKCAVALHLPYAGLNWLAGAFALAGVWVLLRFSPFPRIYRWLLPFTFYLQYQYAVIARPYVLFPLLLFLLCIVFSLAKPRPILYALIAGLLANINAHAAILSCLLTALYAWELYQRRETAGPKLRRRAAIAACLFCVFCLASVLVAFPAPDEGFVRNGATRVKPVNQWLLRLVPPETMPASAPPLDPDEFMLARAKLLTPPPQTFYLRARHIFRLTARVSADVATFPISESNALSLLFLALFALWLWDRRGLRFALPWLFAVPIAAYIWVYDHHSGMFFLALVAAAWLSLCRPLRAPTRGSRIIPAATATVAILVILLQIGWTVHQVRLETYYPYDAAKETEAFITQHYAGKRIAAFGFHSVALQPYADHNLFFNQEHTYWLWSNVNPIDLRRTEVFQQHPDVVLVSDPVEDEDTLNNQWYQEWPSGIHRSADLLAFWQQHGFHETHRFCGTHAMRAHTDISVCDVIFEPNDR